MKILFIYPDMVGERQMNFCPAVHILSAVLKQIGCEVHLLHINDNAVRFEKKGIVEASKGYDLFCFTSTSFNYRYANEIAGWLKESYPNILRVLGGVHATIAPEDYPYSNFDLWCVGEGELAMVDLIKALEAGNDYKGISNFLPNPVRPFIKDLNSLPFIDYSIFDVKKILELKNGWFSIGFSRGCPYGCNFCINSALKKV